eukprot:15359900-Ditylum_brightwellii.AAC.1
MLKIAKYKLVDKVEGKFNIVEAILKGDALTHGLKFKRVEVVRTTYLCNYIKKPNKLSIKNTAVRLRNINGMMARFLAPGNNLMADDELCNILYQMVKHDWHDALRKSGRNPSNMNLQDLTDYFKQIELPE